MIAVAVSDGPEGFERHTFKCLKCAQTDELVLVSGPLKSSAAGWIRSELPPPK